VSRLYKVVVRNGSIMYCNDGEGSLRCEQLLRVERTENK
jgi:hypothetical protein